MDRIAEWRPIDPAQPDGTADTQPADGGLPPPGGAAAQQASSDSWRLVGPVLLALTVLGFAVAGVILLFLVSSMPRSTVAIDGGPTPVPDASDGLLLGGSAQLVDADDVVVDVEGAVLKPGLWRLPAGSRVGDAIAAAGGYSPQIDIAAATAALNLAELVADGQKIHVPLRGEAVATAAPTGPGASVASPGGGGLIDVNTATAEQLDTLPGIGPVTAAKIIAAREEAPFASVDELLGRSVVGASTFEKIKSLISVTP